MQDFKTVEEKAIEWGISTRYIQALCRKDKIKGAIKRAGVWFIPNTTENPKKKGDSSGRYLRFGGTKKKIFEMAVKLFAEKSYEFVTIKDIADEVGIRQSAVYNHFKSKHEILDIIYDFFCYYYIADRPKVEDLEDVLRYGTLLDIMNCVTYNYNEEYSDLMVDITKIILCRGFIDERAREISKIFTVQEGIKFAEDVFNKAIEIGRLAPLNVHAISVLCNSIRLFIFHNWIVDPSVENLRKCLADEQVIFRYATEFLVDLRPPENIQND